MNCDHVKKQLIEMIEPSGLTDEIKIHLEQCSECKSLFDSFNQLQKDFDRDDLFYLDNEQANRFVEEVDAMIDRQELKREALTEPRWKSFVPMAAALVLVLGLALVSQLVNWFQPQNELATVTDDSLVVAVDPDENNILDNIEYDELIVDLETGDATNDLSMMIDDLSEEEYLYMVENMDVGDWL